MWKGRMGERGEGTVSRSGKMRRREGGGETEIERGRERGDRRWSF